MTANQIATFLNNVQKDALGRQAVNVRDTSTLVSLGEMVLSSATNTEQFYQKLVDRIGRTYCLYRTYTATNKADIVKDVLDFGIILQRVQVKTLATATENSSWSSASAKHNPYTYGEDPTDLVQTLYSKLGTWEIEPKVIYLYQLKTAFTSLASMGAFVDMIYADMYNAMEFKIEQCIKSTKATMMAQVLKGTNTNTKRNLLTEYITLSGNTLTAADCVMDKDFLKYASQQINLVRRRFPRMTSLYNSQSADRFTPNEDIRVDLLMEYASAFDSYLYADTFHKEMVALPGYNEVDAWQGTGTTFGDCSKIAIKDENDESTENTVQTGVIACIYDKDASGVMVDRVRTISFNDAPNERTILYHKADWGSFVDTSQNCVVFYVADATA